MLSRSRQSSQPSQSITTVSCVLRSALGQAGPALAAAEHHRSCILSSPLTANQSRAQYRSSRIHLALFLFQQPPTPTPPTHGGHSSPGVARQCPSLALTPPSQGTRPRPRPRAAVTPPTTPRPPSTPPLTLPALMTTTPLMPRSRPLPPVPRRTSRSTPGARRATTASATSSTRPTMTLTRTRSATLTQT